MDVIIIGAGGHGRVVLDILRTAGDHNPVGFLDADPSLIGEQIFGLSVLGTLEMLAELRQKGVGGAIVAIGNNGHRLANAKLAVQSGLELVSAVHPRAVISATAKLGTNLVVAAGAVVGANVHLADSVIVNTAAVVDHDCQIGQGVHIAPGSLLAGWVQVSPRVLIGMGACVIQSLKIGERAVVGAGAVVIRDVPAHATVVGVPARVIKVAPA